MENQKAYNILKILTPELLQGFEKFLDSPYFNESKNVVKLFEVIKIYYPEFTSKELSSDNLHKLVFSNKDSHFSASINNLFTKLIKLAEKFLSIEYILKDRSSLNKALLTFYLKNNNRIFFDQKLHKVKEEILSEKQNDSFNYLQSYLINNLELEYLVKDVYTSKKAISPCVISSNSKDFSVYYYTAICRDYLRFLSFCSINCIDEKIQNDMKIYDSIISGIPIEIENDLLTLYKKFISIFTSPVKPEYSELSSGLISDNINIYSEDKIFLMKILFQYGKMIYDSGVHSIGAEVMNMIKEVNASKLWINPYGLLSEHAYNFMIKFAVEINEFDWAEKFIFENSEIVDSDEKQNVLYYNLAVFFFFKTRSQIPLFVDDFEVSLSYLSKVTSHYPLKKLSIYRLMMMIYMESDQLEFYYYQYDSMIHYLKEHRKSLNDNIYLANLNFAKITYSFAKIIQTESMDPPLMLDSEINSVVNVEEKKWIRETYIALKNKIIA